MTLTGEPDDIKKAPASEFTEHRLGGKAMFPMDIVLSSTVLSAGTCTCIVFATGMTTKVGQMASELTQDKSYLFPVKAAMNRFSTVCLVIGVFVFATVLLWLGLSGYQEPLSETSGEGDRWLVVALTAMQSGMSALPISILPVSLLLLNKALVSLKDQNAKVKRASSVDVLGCVTVICSDKTGTISSGKMTAVKLATFDKPQEADAVEKFEFYPYRGFHPNGGLWRVGETDANAKKIIDQSFVNEKARSDYEQPLRDFSCNALDYADPRNDDKPDAIIPRACVLALTLNSHETILESKMEEDNKGEPKTVWDITGNMSEGALVVAGKKAGFDCKELESSYPRVYEVAFNSQRKMALSVHRLPNAGTANAAFGRISMPGCSYFAVIKGAQDRLNMFVVSQPTLVAGQNDHAIEVPSHDVAGLRQSIADQCQAYNQDGLRALLCVGRGLTEADWDELQSRDAQAIFDALLGEDPVTNSSPKKRKGNSRSENVAATQCMVMGLVGISDPPKFGVREAVEKVNAAGIRVVMITGDHRDTAEYIAKATSIVRKEGACAEVREAKQLRHEDGTMKTNEEIDYMVNRTCVWARAQPVDKIVIVESFQRLKHVVAMTGDGVNDTAALHGADMGIAMGITGTDVAQAEADMILLDDNFSTIVKAIEEGRIIFDQICKFAIYNVSLNFVFIIMIIVCAAFRAPMPWYGISYLFCSGVCSYLASMAFCLGNPQPVDMTVPPRRKNAGFLMRSSMYAFVVPFICVAVAFIFTSYYLTLRTFLGTVQNEFIVGSGLAGAEYNTFYYSASHGMNDLCSYAWTEQPDGKFKQDVRPYHCRYQNNMKTHKPKCEWAWIWSPDDKWQTLDQWGQVEYNEHSYKNAEGTEEQLWDSGLGFPYPASHDIAYWTGLNSALFEKDSGGQEFTSSLLEKKNKPPENEADGLGPEIWVWKDTLKVVMLAMCFHLLVVASGREFLFLPSTLKNLGIHLGVMVIAICTGMLCIFLPYLNMIFIQFVALRDQGLGIFFIFLAAIIVFDETVKMLVYRPRYDSRRRKRQKIAQLAGIGLIEPWASKKTARNAPVMPPRQAYSYLHQTFFVQFL